MPYIPFLDVAVPNRVYVDQARDSPWDDFMPHIEHVKYNFLELATRIEIGGTMVSSVAR